MPIPPLTISGELPVGVHLATMNEVEFCFGNWNNQRRKLFSGLKKVIVVFKAANAKKIFIRFYKNYI